MVVIIRERVNNNGSPIPTNPEINPPKIPITNITIIVVILIIYFYQ